MIALRFQTLKSIVMVRNFKQLTGLVKTERLDNEEGGMLKRSLIQRLHDAASFASVMLTDRYRCHPQILELFNRLNYRSELVADRSTIRDNRHVKVWNGFTANRTLFKRVRGKRRIFIDAPGFAEKREGRTSLFYKGATEVLETFLFDLFQYQTPAGDQILPDDIAIITLYSD